MDRKEVYDMLLEEACEAFKEVIMVDPPEGWRYGFPKEFTFEFSKGSVDWGSHEEVTGRTRELKEWFIENGYPSKEVDLAIEYSRYWKENV